MLLVYQFTLLSAVKLLSQISVRSAEARGAIVTNATYPSGGISVKAAGLAEVIGFERSKPRIGLNGVYFGFYMEYY